MALGVPARRAHVTATFRVALKAGSWVAPRIDDRAGAAASGQMPAARSVAGFATCVAELRIGEDQLAMGRAGKVIELPRVALGALLRADKLGAGDPGRPIRSPADNRAGNKKQAPEGQSSG